MQCDMCNTYVDRRDFADHSCGVDGGIVKTCANCEHEAVLIRPSKQCVMCNHAYAIPKAESYVMWCKECRISFSASYEGTPCPGCPPRLTRTTIGSRWHHS